MTSAKLATGAKLGRTDLSAHQTCAAFHNLHRPVRPRRPASEIFLLTLWRPSRPLGEAHFS